MLHNTVSLLVLACSATKRPGSTPMKAIDRYDGVMWRTLRTALRELPLARQQAVSIWFLSARYGFQSADMLITPYEDRLTSKRANDFLRCPTSNHIAFADHAHTAHRVLLAGGALYRDTMRRAIRHHANVSETDGAGIGFHRQQLREWLASPA